MLTGFRTKFSFSNFLHTNVFKIKLIEAYNYSFLKFGSELITLIGNPGVGLKLIIDYIRESLIGNS